MVETDQYSAKPKYNQAQTLHIIFCDVLCGWNCKDFYTYHPLQTTVCPRLIGTNNYWWRPLSEICQAGHWVNMYRAEWGGWQEGNNTVRHTMVLTLKIKHPTLVFPVQSESVLHGVLHKNLISFCLSWHMYLIKLIISSNIFSNHTCFTPKDNLSSFNLK